MAKPVAYRVFTPPDTREELKRRIDAAPAEHADAILSAYRLLEEAHTLFPEARTIIVTSDTIWSPAKAAEFVARMEAGEIDIVIGTQLVTKGYHFPNLTLVGVVDADLGLSGGDLRAAERTFQQIQQVSGRAGRGERHGRVLVQTHDPSAPVLAVLPGSRRGEVEKLADVFAGAAGLLAKRIAGLVTIAPMVTPGLRDQFAARCAALAPEAKVRMLDGQARRALAAADVVLVASGTASDTGCQAAGRLAGRAGRGGVSHASVCGRSRTSAARAIGGRQIARGCR